MAFLSLSFMRGVSLYMANRMHPLKHNLNRMVFERCIKIEIEIECSCFFLHSICCALAVKNQMSHFTLIEWHKMEADFFHSVKIDCKLQFSLQRSSLHRPRSRSFVFRSFVWFYFFRSFHSHPVERHIFLFTVRRPVIQRPFLTPMKTIRHRKKDEKPTHSL